MYRLYRYDIPEAVPQIVSVFEAAEAWGMSPAHILESNGQLFRQWQVWRAQKAAALNDRNKAK